MSSNAPIIESKSFLFGGVEVVSGLHWNTLSSIQTAGSERPKTIGSSVFFPAGKTSRKLAADFHADIAVWRQSSSQNPVQVGLTQKRNIIGSNGLQYSFASLVLEALSLHNPNDSQTTCLAIQDPDDEEFYYLVIQHEGSLIPGGDIYGPAEIISQAINDNASMGGFSIYAPDSLGIPGSQPLPSADFLIQSMTKAALKTHRLIEVKPNKKRIGLVVVVLALSGGAAFMANNNYQQQLEAESNRLAQEAMAKVLSGNTEDVVVPVVTIIDPKLFFTTCINSFKEQRLFAGGWSFRDAECTPSTLTVYYNRNNSKIEYLSDAYNNAVFSKDGEQASVKTAIKVNSFELNQSELLESALAVYGLNNYAQSNAVEIGLQVEVKEAQPSLPGRDSTEIKPEDKLSKVTWQIVLPISESLENLTVKGSSLKRIHLTTTENILSMTLKGTTYAIR